jgi:hypothetical protein
MFLDTITKLESAEHQDHRLNNALSALARRVALRGGRNARPVSSGPSGRPGVKLEPSQPPVGRLAVGVGGGGEEVRP